MGDYIGTTFGVIKGDTRSLDSRLHRDNGKMETTTLYYQ